MKKLAALSLLFVLAVPVLGDRAPRETRDRAPRETRDRAPRETREREPRSKSIVRIIHHIVRAIGVTGDFPTIPKP